MHSLIDDSILWHKRLGHVNYHSLSQLQKDHLVEGLPTVVEQNEVCGVCQIGKQSKLPFPVNQAWRATEKLQLVHIDLCGPMRTPSLNENIYFILFIDDFSRMSWVFFMRQKSEVATIF